MKFYRHRECSKCESIEETLDDLVLAHTTVVIKDYPKTNALPVDTQPPVLVDDETVYEGEDDILQHIDELKEFRDKWYKYQSDVCYCQDE